MVKFVTVSKCWLELGRAALGPLNDKFILIVDSVTCLFKSRLSHESHRSKIVRHYFCQHFFCTGVKGLLKQELKGLSSGASTLRALRDAIANFYCSIPWARLKSTITHSLIALVFDNEKCS